MDNEKLALEFEFLREKMKQAGQLLMHGSEHAVEVAFMLGCLHSICHQHCADFHKKHRESKHVDS